MPGSCGHPALVREGQAAGPGTPRPVAHSDVGPVSGRPRPPAVTQGAAVLPRSAQAGLLRGHLS